MKKLLLFLALVMASGSVLAHGRGRVQLGLHFGFPLYPYHYWYYPPPPQVYYYPAPPAAPPVYVEREKSEDWWYYCEQSRGYYPYVKECPGGWQRVPPAPPPAK